MSQASVQNLQEKQIVFYEGDTDKVLYKIISGKIAFYKNYGMPGETLLGVSSAPNYFGTMTILSGAPANYTAVAMERSTVLYLPETELETFPKSDPANAVAAMKTLAGALNESDRKLRALLTEIRRLGKAGVENAPSLAALVETYAPDDLIIDRFAPYTPPAVEAPPAVTEVPAAPIVVEAPAAPIAAKAPAAPIVENSPINHTATAAVVMPEPYLPEHKGYPGVTHPEYNKYLIPQDYTCPHCRQKFSGSRIQLSKLIPIRNEAETHRYDLRVSYNDFETEWHEIVTCPHCYFSAFDTFFHDSKSLYRSRYESKLAKLCDNIAIDFTAERDLDAVFAQHYLALTCAPGFTDSRQIIARVWMNLVRLYQDAGEPELAEIAEKNALDAYQKVFMEVELAEGQEQRLCLTVAGILYARGEKRAAREWATRVRHGFGDHSAYWNLAEQLIQDVRAEIAAENS